MPNDLSMIFNVIARDGASPAFRTVAAEAKMLQRAIEESDAKMTASTRAVAASVNASMGELGRAHTAAALQYDRATATEIGANDSLEASQKKLAASMTALVAEQRAAAASAVETGATIDRVAAEEAAATEASAAKRRASMMAFGAASAAALVGVAYYSVKAATSFEASMARVQTMAGASSGELKRMSDGVLALAPKVGVGPDKLAESLYHVESAGFSGAKALDMVAASAKLSAIGQDDINSSTQAVVATLASNIKGVRDANDAAAQILHTVGVGDMTMHQFTQALGTGLLATGAAVGLSFKDIGAAIATMTDNAIPADQAATKLRTSLLMMVNPLGPAAATMRALGMDTHELANDLQKPDGLKVALDDIRTHLNATFPLNAGPVLGIQAQRAAVADYRQTLATAGVQGKELDKAVKSYADSLKHGTTNTVLQEQAFAKMFGGSKNAGTMMVLFNEQLDRMDPKLASFGDATSRAAQLQAAWAKQQDTFKQKLNDLNAAFDVMKIKIGNALLPVLKDVIGFMGSHIGLVEGLAFAIGTVLVAATVAWTLALQTNPVVVFVEALVLVGVEIYMLITHFKEITHWLSGPWGTAISIAVAAAFPFIGIPMLIMGHWRGLLTFFKAVWRDLSNWAVDAWHIINKVARDLGGAAEAIGRFFQRMGHDVMQIIGAAVDFISRHWRLLIVIFTGPIGFVVDLIYKFRKQIGGAFESLWRIVSGFAARMWRDVTGWTSRIWHDGVNHFTRMWHEITSSVSRLWKDVSGFFSNLWHDVTGWTSRVWHDGADHFSRMWHDLTDFAGRIWRDVSKPFSDLWDLLKKGFDKSVKQIDDAWHTLGNIFRVPINFLIRYVYDDGIVKVWDAVMGVVGEDKLKLGRLDEIPAFATGGVIPGNHDRDTVPFYGTPGEVVVPKQVVRRYGGPDSLMSTLGFDGRGGGAGSHLAGGGPLNLAIPGFDPSKGDLGAGVRGVQGFVADRNATIAAGNAADAQVTSIWGALAHLARGALADTAGPALNAVISLLSKAMPGNGPVEKTTVELSHKMVDKVMNWIRGQDAKDQAAMAAMAGGDGMSWPLILQYAYAHGIPHGAVTTTGGEHVAGSYHYMGEAVDFGNAAFPNQRQVFDVFSKISPDLLEMFWDPAGRYVKNGQWINGAIGGHGDHVHVAASLAGMDQALGIPISTAGGGVKRWDGVIAAALAMNGLSPSLLGVVERQMQTESGGNASILQQVRDINSGANAARGLMQVIPTTFSAYHMAGTSGDILDPLANVAAALNYAKHRYGPGLAGLGQGHGYANGGMPPIGQPFMVGENGPELMVAGTQTRVYSNQESRKMVGGLGALMHVEHQYITGPIDFQTQLRDAQFTQQMQGGF